MKTSLRSLNAIEISEHTSSEAGGELLAGLDGGGVVLDGGGVVVERLGDGVGVRVVLVGDGDGEDDVGSTERVGIMPGELVDGDGEGDDVLGLGAGDDVLAVGLGDEVLGVGLGEEVVGDEVVGGGVGVGDEGWSQRVGAAAASSSGG